MNLSGAVLLDGPNVESDRLFIPGHKTLEDYVTDWSKEFEAEKERIDRFRFMNLNQQWSGVGNVASQFVTPASFTGTVITDVGPAPDFTLPAGVPPGTLLRLIAVGQFVCSGSATNLTVQFMYGGTGGTSLYSTGAVALTTSATNPWRVEALIRVLTAGTSGTAIIFGQQQGISTTANININVQTRTSSVSINTTTANSIIVAATASTALTSFNVDTFVIEQLN